MRTLLLLDVISCVIGTATSFVAVDHLAAFSFPCQPMHTAVQRARLRPCSVLAGAKLQLTNMYTLSSAWRAHRISLNDVNSWC